MFSSQDVRNAVSDVRFIQHMLDFERALTFAEAVTGVIPQSAVEPISRSCRAELFNLDELASAAAKSGNLAIPLVKALTANVAKVDANAAKFVHWGATSQDVIDTATMLMVHEAIGAIVPLLDRAIDGFSALAEGHRHTPTIARTWLQHALPMPFGLKLAGYAAALNRSRHRLTRTCANEIVLQFGGAAGTLAALGDRGVAVSEALAKALSLPLPDAPWHTHRDRIAELSAVLAILTGTCGKIARDVSLLMQTDVAEVFEPAGEGRGGSSTMPHKRNPVAAASALAAATMAPNLAATIFAAQVQDHERSAGSWHAEWPTLPALLAVTSGAVSAITDMAEGLEIDVGQMRKNIDRSQGLVMSEAVAFSLAEKIGKSDAHHLLEKASRVALLEGRHLYDVLASDPEVAAQFSKADLAKLFDPVSYEGSSQVMINRLLASLEGRSII